jgi:hypothetical protein
MRTLAKSCVFLVCFFVLFKIIDHGSRRGNTARALAQWRHLMALHEATDALYRAMRITPYRPGGMVINIIVDLPAFFIILDSVVAHNHS